MTLSVTQLTPSDLVTMKDQLLRVYQATFSQPPFLETEADVQRFERSLTSHAARPGFRACGAVETESSQLVGFAYGYTSLPGQWWHDTVAAALPAHAVARWFADCFEVVTIAVHPVFQGQGGGGGLHDSLLGGLPHRTAVLSTLQQETAARQLYRTRGWQIVHEPFNFPGGAQPYAILGRVLGSEVEPQP
jgi:GNAT superfamily N-acetyltransferase